MNTLSGFLYQHDTGICSAKLLRAMSSSFGQDYASEKDSLALSETAGISSCPIQPIAHHGRLGSIVGTPNWTDEELSRIAREHGHSRALLSAYEKHSLDFVDYLHGHFAFALLDELKRILLVGIDRAGVHSLYYYLDPAGGVVFSSSATAVLAHPAVPNGLSDQGIFNYIYFHMVPSPSSVYSKLSKLGPAQYLIFQDNTVKIKDYWAPTFTEDSNASFKDLASELKKSVLLSVKESAALSPRIGCFLSGGIDSSTVVGALSNFSSTPVKTFSIGFNADGYDETPYARIVAKKFSTIHHEYFVTPDDVVDFVPKMAASYAEPFGNASAIPAYFCAKLAKEHGVDIMLAGDGGDEIFAGNERYAKQAIFENYFLVPESIRTNILESAFASIPSLTRFGPLRKISSYIQQANTPLPDRLESYNFLHRIDIADIFSQDFLDNVRIDEPINLIRTRFFSVESATKLNRMLYQDWKFTLADNDLRKVSQMSSLAGVDVVYPLLSDRLIELSCKVPSDIKIKNGRLRYFFKRAMQDLLPDEVIKKKKHGFGLPFGVWMREYKPLQEIAYDSIAKLKTRKYFQAQFLDRAIELHRSGHAAYYGGLIWVLMVLELWLSASSRNIR